MDDEQFDYALSEAEALDIAEAVIAEGDTRDTLGEGNSYG